jgi:hypothetical protein
VTTPERLPSPDSGNDAARSSVGMKLQQRKAQRYLLIGFLVIFVMPIAVFLLAVLGGPIGFVIATILGGVVWLAFYGLIPAAILGALGWVIYSHYSKSARPESGAVLDRLRSLQAINAGNPPPGAPSPASPATPSDADLSPDVAALEVLRNELKQEATRRQYTYVPLALAAAFAFCWFMFASPGKQSGSPTIAFILVMGITGFLAWIYATAGPASRYALAFKQKLLPRLLARYGELTHAIGDLPPIARLVEVGLLPIHDTASADDTIRGTYRGRTIRISELSLVRNQGKRNKAAFNGLLIEMTVSPPFASTTLITENDALNNTTISDHSLQRVRLEDPRFDEVYRVFGTDQIAARAVLMPAVMEKLLVLADGKSFNPPYFFCEGTRMVFALVRCDGLDMLEPPSFSSNDAALQLATVEAELAVIFGLIDTMIEMQEALIVLSQKPAGKLRSESVSYWDSCFSIGG